jgi:hypothetical protein
MHQEGPSAVAVRAFWRSDGIGLTIYLFDLIHW